MGFGAAAEGRASPGGVGGLALGAAAPAWHGLTLGEDLVSAFMACRGELTWVKVILHLH